MDIILASKSPRRREILNLMGITDYEIIPAADEKKVSGKSPAETVSLIAQGKAESVAREHKNALVIAADTLVYLDGAPLGKPKDEDDAFRMLSLLSGRAHEVFTGVCLMRGGKSLCAAERTLVRFRKMSDAEIRGYIATGEPMDKAGAYGAQGFGAVFIEGIEGDFFNVMGLPACRLGLMLKEF